jgi:hypothetical protein
MLVGIDPLDGHEASITIESNVPDGLDRASDLDFGCRGLPGASCKGSGEGEEDGWGCSAEPVEEEAERVDPVFFVIWARVADWEAGGVGIRAGRRLSMTGGAGRRIERFAGSGSNEADPPPEHLLLLFSALSRSLALPPRRREMPPNLPTKRCDRLSLPLVLSLQILVLDVHRTHAQLFSHLEHSEKSCSQLVRRQNGADGAARYVEEEFEETGMAEVGIGQARLGIKEGGESGGRKVAGVELAIARPSKLGIYREFDRRRREGGRRVMWKRLEEGMLGRRCKGRGAEVEMRRYGVRWWWTNTLRSSWIGWGEERDWVCVELFREEQRGVGGTRRRGW